MADLLPEFNQQLTQRNAAALKDLGKRDEEWIRDALSVDVEYEGSHIIRSAPGDFPRRETGELQGTIASEPSGGGDGAAVAVSAGPAIGDDGQDYAYTLEYGGYSGGHHILPRPFMSKAFTMTEGSYLEFIAERLRS